MEPSATSDLFLVDDLLTDEERAVRDRVRRFSDEEVRPVINDYWERAEFPFELIPKLAALVVWARDGNGEVGAYVVEKGTPGFETRLITGKMAKRASWQADLTMRDVRVPAENRLEGATTFDAAAAVLARARPGIAWGALGHAVAAYDAAVAYCLERQQFGTPIAGYQLTRFRLAKMLADVTAMRLICMRLAALVDEGRLTPAMASLAKMHNAEKALSVISALRARSTPRAGRRRPRRS